MNWINIVTLCISIGTFIMLIVNSFKDYLTKKKERRITIVLSERRRMQNDLFEHITKVLDLGRRCLMQLDDDEKQKISLELLNHKIFIWINLNTDNRYAKDLRENSNSYIIWCVTGLGINIEAERYSSLLNAQKRLSVIWQLIDKYIEEENKLIEELI